MIPSSPPPLVSTVVPNPIPLLPAATHQERLEEASQVCARGRELWTQSSRHRHLPSPSSSTNPSPPQNTNNTTDAAASAAAALAEFEHALRLLEPLLGTYHSLTAKTYYWIGFIQKHDPSTYSPALQAFVHTARIRLVLYGPSHESTHEALSAIRWVLQEWKVDSMHSKNLLQLLYESIRLETLGDAQLRHKNYDMALDYYQQAAATTTTTTAVAAAGASHSSSSTFSSPSSSAFSSSTAAAHYATAAAILLSCTPSLWGKRAFCHSKLPMDASTGSSSTRTSSNNNNNNTTTTHDPQRLLHHQQALVGYRQALQLFICTTVHGTQHFDIPQTMERIQSLLLLSSTPSSSPTHAVMDKTQIQDYLSNIVLKSVVLEYEAKQALNQGRCRKALEHYQLAWKLESAVLGTHHLVCRQLQQTIDSIRWVMEQTPQWAHLVSTLQQDKLDLQAQLTVYAAGGRGPKGPKGAHETSNKDAIPAPLHIAVGATSHTYDLDNKNNNEDDSSAGFFTPTQQRLQQTKNEAEYGDMYQQLQALQTEQLEWKTKSEKDRSEILDLESRLLLQQQQQQQQQQQIDPTMIASTGPDSQQQQKQHFQEVHTQVLTQELAASQQLTTELQARLEHVEQALSGMTRLRQVTQSKLDTALSEQNELQSNIHQQDFSIRTMKDQLKLLQDQNEQLLREQQQLRLQQDSTSSFMETPPSSPAKSRSTSHHHYHPGTPMSSVSDLRPSETQRNLALQLRELQSAQSMEKLQSQNARAVTTIQALSKELTHLESKYRKLFSKYEKTKLLFRQLESRHTTLRERVRVMEGVDERQRGMESVGGVMPSPQINQPRNSDNNDGPSSAILRSVRLSQYRYETSFAQYIIRRPYGMDDSGYFDDASANTYQRQADVKNSLTIHVVAVVPWDQSRLYLSSLTGSVVHRRVDGSCIELTVEPLGWVTLSNDLSYSLDALVEEAQIFRDHYCQSIHLNAKPVMWKQRILQLVGRHWKVAEPWAYRYGSNSYHRQGHIDQLSLLMIGMTLLILFLAMVLR